MGEEGSASWPGSRWLWLLSAGGKPGHSCLREGRKWSGTGGKASEPAMEKHGPRLVSRAWSSCRAEPGAVLSQLAQKGHLVLPTLQSSRSQRWEPARPPAPNHQGPHTSAEPTAETQDVFHTTASLSRENPAKLILHHQSSSFICSRRLLTWKCDRSPKPTAHQQAPWPALARVPSRPLQPRTPLNLPDGSPSRRQTKQRGAVLWLAQGETLPSPNSPDR